MVVKLIRPLILATTFLFFNPEPQPGEPERQYINFLLTNVGLRPDRKLQTLACWQSHSMAVQRQISELDINFNDFGQRLKIFNLDCRLNRFDEFYFKTWYVFKDDLQNCLDEIKQMSYTHYGLGLVRSNDGYFYITITLANYTEYADNGRSRRSLGV